MNENPVELRPDDLPPRDQWLEDVDNPRTTRSYEAAISDFLHFWGNEDLASLRSVTRPEIEAWRDDLVNRKLSASTVRSRLAGISYLFDLLADKRLVPANPVAGVKRPTGKSEARKDSSITKMELRALANLPDKESIKGLRDRAILAVLAFHEISPEEIEQLRIGDLEERASDGLPCFTIRNGEQPERSIPIHAGALQRIYQYLGEVDQADDLPLFRPVRNNVSKTLDSSLSASGIRKGVVSYWLGKSEDSGE